MGLTPRSVHDVCLLTENRYLHRKSDDAYICNIFQEDDLLQEALAKNGITSIRASWEDEHFDWSSVRLIVFRTPWNYFERFPSFLEWLNKAASKTSFLNQKALIEWNLDKSYLWELAAKGVSVPNGFYFLKSCPADLEQFCLLTTWREWVIKPAVSGTARHTYRLNPANLNDLRPVFNDLLKDESMMLQAFQESVLSRGEVSLVMLGGKFSHAVLKMAKPGDFRVQDDFGGSLHDYEPAPEEISLAEYVLALCPEIPVYARVDLIRAEDGRPLLTELELIEPELWFRRNPSSAGILAGLIAVELKKTAT